MEERKSYRQQRQRLASEKKLLELLVDAYQRLDHNLDDCEKLEMMFWADRDLVASLEKKNLALQAKIQILTDTSGNGLHAAQEVEELQPILSGVNDHA